MPGSRLDSVYRKIILSKFFTKGWGDPYHLLKLFSFRKLVSDRTTCYQLVPKDHPITITKEHYKNGYKLLEGKFLSPLNLYLPDVLPTESQMAYFQMVLPYKWNSLKPICLHLAGTGDHNYWRRKYIMAKPLLKHGIGSIIVENPFYGYRKPKDQIRSSLHNVSDIFVMGGCLILESIALLNWCEMLGYGPLGLSGVSMGGHMASLAATNWPKPIVLVPCLSWTTASTAFIEGVMSRSIDWNMLQDQYLSNSIYYDKLTNLITTADNDHFKINKDDRKYIKFKSIPKIFPRYYNTISHSRRPKEAVKFMCGMMDECTHLKNFSLPYDTSLITVVCAQEDAYIPRQGCAGIEDIWPGATVRYINAGHVSAFLRYNKFFRKCIVQTFDKAKNLEKYKIQ